MEFHVTLAGRGHLADKVYRELRAAIIDGRLRPGDSVPPTRELARRLSISRNTVTTAYDRLTAEGFLAGRVGAGTFVREEGVLPPRSRRAPAGGALRPRALWQSLIAPPPAPAAPVDYDFQLGVPDARLFPWDTWRRLVARQMRPARIRTANYALPVGHPRLREAIARHVGVARSVQAGADDIVVTSGAQQAFDLIGRVLLDPGACVAVEDPGHPPAGQLFRSLGARVVPVPVDGEGLVVDALPADARLVFVTPSHQCPLGMPMSLARRVALLAWAEAHGAAVVEDDYDSEFRYGGRPLEPLQSLDRAGRVLYVGSFSKVLLPTLRLGFVVAPASLVAGLRTARLVSDWHGPLETQLALAEFMEQGLLARHVRRVRRVYEKRRARLLEALDRHLAAELEVVPSSAGLHVSAFLRDRRRDTDALARDARAIGLAIEPLAPYYRGRQRAGLALGYGVIPLSKIEEGVRRLAACLHGRDVRSSRRARRGQEKE
jgi:GntR family transcriptional regulator / MocR family aminotransferase